MNELTILCICFLLTSCCICAKLPSSFEKCNRYQSNLNECLRKAAENAIRQLDKPIKSIGLNSLNPLEVPLMMVHAGSRSFAFQQNYKNLKIYGFTNIKLLNLEIDFERKTLFMDCLFPHVRWDFDYDFHGMVVTTPLNGTGSGLTTMENVRYTLTFTLDEYEKKGKKHYKVVDVKCRMDPELVQAKLDGLDDAEHINMAFNSNWRMLFEEVRPDYEYAFGQIFSTLFKSLLAHVPIEELFITPEFDSTDIQSNRPSQYFTFSLIFKLYP